MISERTFSSEFSGFWTETLPFLTPQAVTDLNLNKTSMADRSRDWMRPIDGCDDKTNYDLIAEIAFALFAESIKTNCSLSDLENNAELVEEISNAAIVRVLDLRNQSDSHQGSARINIAEAMELAARLVTYFQRFKANSIIVQPLFKGCGILNSCYGDVLAKHTLCELKMVDRNLRGTDIRQLLCYCALNYRSSQYEIDTVTVLNPRRGWEFKYSVEELAQRVSRNTAAELFHRIATFLSDFDTIHQSS